MAVRSMPTMRAVSTMAVEVAIGTTTGHGRGKRVWSSRRERVLVVAIRIRATKGHQLVGGWGWATLEGVVAWIRHHAGCISTRGSLVGNVRPLRAGVVGWLPGAGRIARVVVVAVQTV
jgi:hypothetical protein